MPEDRLVPQVFRPNADHLSLRCIWHLTWLESKVFGGGIFACTSKHNIVFVAAEAQKTCLQKIHQHNSVHVVYLILGMTLSYHGAIDRWMSDFIHVCTHTSELSNNLKSPKEACPTTSCCTYMYTCYVAAAMYIHRN